MHKTVMVGVVALVAFVTLQSPALGLEKKNYNYSEWTKGRFAEVVTVVNPGKWIFLAGIGPEREGDIYERQ